MFNIQAVILNINQYTKNNDEAKEKIYGQWYDSLGKEEKDQLNIQHFGQIKMDSESQMKKIYEAFHSNRKFISFWLTNCVFPKDMLEYSQSLTSSSWDHSNVQSSIGFSGTKDMYPLFPKYLKFQNSTNKSILGTDGKMLAMALQNTLDIVQMPSNQAPLWKTIVKNMLKFQNVGCIIDVGALLSDGELQNDIVQYIGNKAENQITKKYRGISFCCDNAWQTYDMRNSQIYPKGIIPDHQTFVIFDEYQTRGADFKMDKDITGIVTLGPCVTKANLMQGIGRLRKLGRNQKIVIFMSQQVRSMCGFQKSMTVSQKLEYILRWCCANSIKENQKFLFQNSKLAKVHLSNQQLHSDLPPITSKIDTTLSSLYAAPTSLQSVHDLSLSLFKEMESQDSTSIVDDILRETQRFGQQVLIRSENVDEVKEKETELEVQKQKAIQYDAIALDPWAETQSPKLIEITLPDIKLDFANTLKYSRNFKQCTKYRCISQIEEDDKSNELGLCHFVYLTPKYLGMLTIRQVNDLLNSFPLYSPAESNPKRRYISRLSDLSIQSRYLIQNGLQEAYVQCRFFNGERKFNQQEATILKQLFVSKGVDENGVAYFLKKRRLQNLYPNSSLEAIYKEIELIKRQ